jgi:hypothetical protein
LAARTFGSNFASLFCFEIEFLKGFVIDNVKIDGKNNYWNTNVPWTDKNSKRGGYIHSDRAF